MALSSCKVEYVAATITACQGIWLAKLIGELMNEEMISMTLMVDNKSAIALSKNPMFHNRSKHIETKFHKDFLGRKEDGGGLHKLKESTSRLVYKGIGKTKV